MCARTQAASSIGVMSSARASSRLPHDPGTQANTNRLRASPWVSCAPCTSSSSIPARSSSRQNSVRAPSPTSSVVQIVGTKWRSVHIRINPDAASRSSSVPNVAASATAMEKLSVRKACEPRRRSAQISRG
jgi:hypothetical protein